MRVTLLHVFLALSCMSYCFAGTADGQEVLDKRISLNLSSKEIKTVLRTITTSAEVGFTYNSRILPGNRKITVIANEERLGDVLSRIFGPLDISYEAIGRQIVLKKRKDQLADRLSKEEITNEIFKLITGTVLSGDNTPLPGVSVTVAGSSRGTVTDEKGHFRMEANEGEVLVFSFIGFQTVRITVGATPVINVTMVKSDNSLNDVVVTALGISRTKRAIGYSQEQIKGSEVARSNAPNVINALSGKMAGVNITNPNGVDGGSTRIVIGGNNQITGDNQPLIIVDGMPLSNDASEPYNALTSPTGSALFSNSNSKDASAPKDWGSPINLINPQDIENISVLKGPTAAALYGGKGANGVILITTKKGARRQGLGIDYNFGYKSVQPYHFLKMQNEYGAGGMVSLDPPAWQTDAGGKPMLTDGWNQLFVDPKTGTGPYGQNTWDQVSWPGSGSSWGPKMDGTMIKWWDGVERPDVPQPGNIKLLYKNGMQATHTISVSGGNDWGTIRASYTRLDNSAVLPNSNYDQNTFNLGANMKLSSRLNLQVTTSYFVNKYLNAPQLGNDDANSWQKRLLYNAGRDYKGEDITMYKNADGSQNPLSGFPWIGNGGFTVWNIMQNNTWQYRRKLLGAVQLNYEATDFLDFLFRAGIDNNNNELVTRNTPTDAIGLKGSYAHGTESGTASNFDFIGTLHKENIAKTDINAKFSVGATIYQRNQSGILATNSTWAFPNAYSLNAGTYIGNPAAPVESILQKKMNSVYSFLNLSYKDFLYLDVTGRNDWSSALPKGQWSYFFPSFAGSFIFSDALHIDPAVLSFGKIRAAWAEAATDPQPYQVNYNFTIGSFGGQTTAQLPNSLPATNYKPAINQTADFGVVLGFLRNRINLDLRYFRGRSKNQILNSPLPISSGVSGIVINTGVLENSGIEGILNIKAVDKPGFKWDISLNASHYSNRLLSLAQGATKVDLASIWNDGGSHGPLISVKVGDQFGTIYGYDHVYDQKTGLPILITAPFGNAAMNGTLYQATSTPVPIGNTTPKFRGGITNTFTFKGGLSISTLVDCKVGGQIWSGTYATMMQQGLAPETLKERDGGGLAYTTPNNTQTNWGVILPGVFANGTINTNVVHYYYKYMQYGVWSSSSIMGSDWIDKNTVLKDTWFKMREISINYALPDKLVKKSKVFQTASLSLVGRDLFYIYSSLPDNVNPEGTNGVGNAQGLEFASLPSFRSLGFQVRLSF
ncbi:MAG TPA: SusC/RagA family TonB-linked outer membrane protein [Puia sp.]|nr:SusC/RagA family TonB-linked outer membrane protein [Puia sp.]